MTARPTILLPCDVKPIGPGRYHCVGEKYIDAVAHGANAWPLLVPAFGDRNDERARAILAEHFPGRRAISLPSVHLTVGLGSFHCLTQQQPVV